MNEIAHSTRITLPSVQEPTIAIRLAQLDETLFSAVLRLYRQTVDAKFTDDELHRVVIRELYDRIVRLRDGSQSEEWRLGSKHGSNSKLKIDRVSEDGGKNPNPILCFWFNANALSGIENADHILTRNQFQIAVDELLRQTEGSLPLTNAKGWLELQGPGS